MLAKVQKFSIDGMPGVKSAGIWVEAVTANEIMVRFLLPVGTQVSLSDEFDFDLERVDCEQDVPNLTKGTTHRVRVEEQNIGDSRLPGGHVSRFPSLERRRGA